MKNLFCILTILLCSFAVFGQKETDKTPDKITDIKQLQLPQLKRSKPKIEMPEALKLMEKYLKNEKINTSDFYISHVNMIQYGSENDKKPAWYFWWVNIDGSLGNYIEIVVFMDGNVGRLPSM